MNKQAQIDYFKAQLIKAREHNDTFSAMELVCTLRALGYKEE